MNLPGLGGGYGVVDWLFWLLPVVLTIAFWSLVIMLVAKLLQGRASHDAPKSSALQVLEERYARGEISRDEFLERKAVLSTLPPRSGP